MTNSTEYIPQRRAMSIHAHPDDQDFSVAATLAKWAQAGCEILSVVITRLSLITIFYNIAEGIISVYFGASDDALALLGFGVDSFVEVISGIGIAHMILRMKYSKVDTRDTFEKTALRVTGTTFYLLTVGLIAGSVLNIINDVKPESTLPGIIIASISILTMYWLMTSKLKVGKALHSCYNRRCKLH